MKKQLLILTTLLTVSNFSTLASECLYQNGKVEINESVLENLKLVEIATAKFSRNDNLYINSATGIHLEDKRVQRTSKSPKFLDAVGRLTVTFVDNTIGYCTANLTDTTPGRASRTLTTAKHCLTNKRSGAKLKSMKWETKLKDGSVISMPATVEMSDKSSDTALLSLPIVIPFSKIKPLLLESEYYFTPIDIQSYSKNTIAAGFSADKEIGEGGKKMTYTDNLQNKNLRNIGNSRYLLNTFNYEGGSGGALIADADMSEEDIDNPYNQKYLIGIASSILDSEYITARSSNGALGSNTTVYIDYTRFFIDDGHKMFDRINE
ncbi:hypothetical protein HBN50_13550 [Halobacteriovorax sp. GB3]|uniref:hypothetical protein n=1 Tax=Halobacteriovorax sp. GB3 TaxID=2719615 RepID=UPI002360ED35|nr:hypothetical protein [Halobacteriovorax sp. GB3]MDD0854132.1 hypothetical protein [Halobacteriovorax sp. GB3]